MHCIYPPSTRINDNSSGHLFTASQLRNTLLGKKHAKEKTFFFQAQLFNLVAKHYTVMYVSCLKEASGVKTQYDVLAKEQPFDEDNLYKDRKSVV